MTEKAKEEMYRSFRRTIITVLDSKPRERLSLEEARGVVDSVWKDLNREGFLADPMERYR